MAQDSSTLTRLFQNLLAGILDSLRIGNGPLSGFTLLRKYFGSEDLRQVSTAVSESEQGHKGEIRVAIETKIPLFRVLAGKTAQQRAVEMFSFLRVWDTEENTGILVYLLLSERKIVILADRGIYKKIGQAKLDEISRKIGTGFHSGKAKEALVQGIRELGSELKKYFPTTGKNPNELPDSPYIG